MRSDYIPVCHNPYTVELSTVVTKQNLDKQKKRDEEFEKRSREQAAAAAATAATADAGHAASKSEADRIAAEKALDADDDKELEKMRLAAEKSAAARKKRNEENDVKAAAHAAAKQKEHDDLVVSNTQNIVLKLEQVLDADVEIVAAHHKIATCTAERTRLWNLLYTEYDLAKHLEANDACVQKITDAVQKEPEDKLHKENVPKIMAWLEDLKAQNAPNETIHVALPAQQYTKKPSSSAASAPGAEPPAPASAASAVPSAAASAAAAKTPAAASAAASAAAAKTPAPAAKPPAAASAAAAKTPAAAANPPAVAAAAANPPAAGKNGKPATPAATVQPAAAAPATGGADMAAGVHLTAAIKKKELEAAEQAHKTDTKSAEKTLACDNAKKIMALWKTAQAKANAYTKSTKEKVTKKNNQASHDKKVSAALAELKQAKSAAEEASKAVMPAAASVVTHSAFVYSPTVFSVEIHDADLYIV